MQGITDQLQYMFRHTNLYGSSDLYNWLWIIYIYQLSY